MPDLDLGPNDYRTKGPDGRWRIPDDPKLARNMMVVMVGVLGFVWWNIGALSPGNVFFGAAIPAFVAGIMLATWLKNVY
jgi:hypothetical protein